jgi:hypothetical protein
LLLADVISNVDKYPDRIAAFPDHLQQVLEAVESTFPDEPPAAVQSAAVNMAIVEFLSSTKPKLLEKIVKFIKVCLLNSRITSRVIFRLFI